MERSCSWNLPANFPRHKQMITNNIVSIKGDKAESWRLCATCLTCTFVMYFKSTTFCPSSTFVSFARAAMQDRDFPRGWTLALGQRENSFISRRNAAKPLFYIPHKTTGCQGLSGLNQQSAHLFLNVRSRVEIESVGCTTLCLCAYRCTLGTTA